MPDAPAIIGPPRRRREAPFGSLAVMAATHPDVALLRRQLALSQVTGEPLFLSRCYSGDSQLPAFSLTGPFMGAPQAAMLMETLASWGARRFIFLGWCGALAPSLENGDILLPCGAYVDEGTTRAYGCDANRVQPSAAEFQSELNTHLRQNGLVCKDGWVWTTDAVFRETETKVRRYQDLGALAVEMELSALYTVGSHLSVELAAVLVVSDELSTLKWRPGFKSDRFKATRTAVCEAIASYVERPQP